MPKIESAPPPAARDALFLFGSPRLRYAGESVAVGLDWHKPVALLAYLALRPGWHGREALAAALRPEAAERAARGYVRRLLHRTGEVFPRLASLQMEDDRVCWTGDSDVAWFERAVEQGQWARAIELQPEALLHRVGSTGEESLDDWFHEERLRLRQKLGAALMGRIVEVRREPQGEAAELMQGLAQLDPLDEGAVQFLLAQAHTARERHVAAGAYQALQRRSVTELGQKPLAHTAELFAALQPQPRGAAPLARAAVPPAGETAAGRARQAPLGREAELEQLLGLLGQPQVRLITICGFGGAGKTLLARALFEAVRAAGRQEAAWVDLLAAQTQHALLDALATQVGMTALDGPVEQQLGHWLAARSMVVFLDNFEQLAGYAPVLERLLRAAPATRLVVTSREALRLAQEYLYALPGLRWQGEDAPAARLFELHAARMGHAVAPQERPHIAELVAYLEGLPLAIELAAHWVTLMPVQDVLAELRQDFTFLDGAADGSPSSRSMQSVLHAGWSRLDATERHALASLSLVRGAIDLETAKNVSGLDAGVMLRLANRSLLQREPEGALRMHALLREFARAQAEPTAQALALERHAEHFLRRLAQPQDLHIGQFVPQRLRQLLPHAEDIAAAWRWAVDHGRFEVVAAAASNLGTLLVMAGRFEEVASLSAHAAAAATQEHSALLPMFAAFRAMAVFRLGRIDEAQEIAGAGLTDDARGNARALLHLVLARVHRFHGRHALALSQAHAAVAAEPDDGHRAYIQLSSMEEVALCHWTLGELDAAQECLLGNLSHAKRHAAAYVEARSLCLLGIIKNAAGAAREGLTLLETAAARFAEIGDAFQVAYCQRGMSYVYLSLGDLPRQEAMAQVALATFRRLGASHEVAESLFALVVAHDAAGRTEVADPLCREALRLGRKDGNRPVMLRCIGALGAFTVARDRECGLALMCFVAAHPALRRPDLAFIERRLVQLGASASQLLAARERAQRWTLEAVADYFLGAGGNEGKETR